MAEFKIGRLRVTWGGPWATGTFYNRDYVIQHGGNTKQGFKSLLSYQGTGGTTE